MSDTKLQVLTPQNCQLIFIDHQPQMAFGVHSIDRQTLKNNTVGLAKAAKVFKVPTIIIPGNDNTHSSGSALVAQKLIPGSELHRLPITDQDVPLIPFPEWGAYEEEIARVFVDFMQRALARAKTAA